MNNNFSKRIIERKRKQRNEKGVGRDDSKDTLEERINISYSNIIARLDTVQGTIDRGVGAKSRTGFVGRGRGNRSTCERTMSRISTNPR